MDPHEHEAREARLERYERAAESRARFEPLFYEVNDATSSTKDEGQQDQSADGEGPLADGEGAGERDGRLGAGCAERTQFSTALDGILEQHAARDVPAG